MRLPDIHPEYVKLGAATVVCFALSIFGFIYAIRSWRTPTEGGTA